MASMSCGCSRAEQLEPVLGLLVMAVIALAKLDESALAKPLPVMDCEHWLAAAAAAAAAAAVAAAAELEVHQPLELEVSGQPPAKQLSSADGCPMASSERDRSSTRRRAST